MTVEDLKITRPLIKSSAYHRKEVQAFADASTIGFGAITYLRTFYNNGDVSCKFVLAKSREAPLKPKTIPRLELSAAVAAVRLTQAVLSSGTTLSIKVDKVVYGSDSMTVLRWINSSNFKFQVFVANRIGEILGAEQWHHVMGKENPADEASRGLTASEMKANSR